MSKNQLVAPQPSMLASLIHKEMRSYRGISNKVIKEYQLFKKQAPTMAGLVLHRSREAM